MPASGRRPIRKRSRVQPVRFVVRNCQMRPGVVFIPRAARGVRSVRCRDPARRRSTQSGARLVSLFRGRRDFGPGRNDAVRCRTGEGTPGMGQGVCCGGSASQSALFSPATILSRLLPSRDRTRAPSAALGSRSGPDGGSCVPSSRARVDYGIGVSLMP